MKPIFFALFALSAFAANAQLLLTPELDVHRIFNQAMLFNPKAVAANKIKSVTGRVAIKHDNKRIRKLGLIEYYEFDPKGHLVKQYSTFFGAGHKPDTLVKFYEYDKNGMVTSRRASDSYGYATYCFEYDAACRPVAKKYSREENALSMKTEFAEKACYVVKEETFCYEFPAENIIKKVYLNENGKPYQEEIFEYDESGKVSMISKKLKVAGNKQIEKYFYDEQNKLIKKEELSNFTQRVKKTYQYIYDEQNRLASIKMLKNGEPMKTTDFVYAPNTNLLKARLIRDHQLKAINIVEYEYAYF